MPLTGYFLAHRLHRRARSLNPPLPLSLYFFLTRTSAIQIYTSSLHFRFFFFLMIRRPRSSPLFPYPPLSQSVIGPGCRAVLQARGAPDSGGEEAEQRDLLVHQDEGPLQGAPLHPRRALLGQRGIVEAL